VFYSTGTLVTRLRPQICENFIFNKMTILFQASKQPRSRYRPSQLFVRAQETGVGGKRASSRDQLRHFSWLTAYDGVCYANDVPAWLLGRGHKSPERHRSRSCAWPSAGIRLWRWRAIALLWRRLSPLWAWQVWRSVAPSHRQTSKPSSLSCCHSAANIEKISVMVNLIYVSWCFFCFAPYIDRVKIFRIFFCESDQHWSLQVLKRPFEADEFHLDASFNLDFMRRDLRGIRPQCFSILDLTLRKSAQLGSSRLPWEPWGCVGSEPGRRWVSSTTIFDIRQKR